MDCGKSLRIAMAMSGEKNKDVAKALNITKQAVSNFKGKQHWHCSSIESMAAHFEIKVSEFIALGE